MLSGGGGAVRRELLGLPHSNGSHNDHTKNITIAVCSIGHAGSLLPLSIFLTLLHFLSGRCLGVARVRGRGSRGVALEATFLHWGIKRGLSVCLPAQSISSIRSDTNILWLAICLAETVSRGARHLFAAHNVSQNLCCICNGGRRGLGHPCGPINKTVSRQ